MSSSWPACWCNSGKISSITTTVTEPTDDRQHGNQQCVYEPIRPGSCYHESMLSTAEFFSITAYDVFDIVTHYKRLWANVICIQQHTTATSRIGRNIHIFKQNLSLSIQSMCFRGIHLLGCLTTVQPNKRTIWIISSAFIKSCFLQNQILFNTKFFIAIHRRTSPVLYKTANQKIMRVLTACGSQSPIWAASRSTSDV